MDMYLEKMQLRYHTPEEAKAIWEKAEKKAYKEKIKTAKSLLDVLDIEIIARKFEMTEEEIEDLKNNRFDDIIPQA